MNLALVCDVILAGESARFDTRFLQLGIHPGGGHTWMMRNLVGPKATAAMVLFGERVDGATAERIGLAWRCVPDDQLLDAAKAMAARAVGAPPELLRPHQGDHRRAWARSTSTTSPSTTSWSTRSGPPPNPSSRNASSPSSNRSRRAEVSFARDEPLRTSDLGRLRRSHPVKLATSGSPHGAA